VSKQDDLFPEERARALRDDGIARAAEHAGNEWQGLARGALLDFMRSQTDDFATEDVRAWATWVPEPPDRRAWGAVMIWAVKAGWIRRVGYRQHHDPARHCGTSTVWKKTGVCPGS
jgi:hypothetical protein